MLKIIFLDIDGVLNFDGCDRMVANAWHECSPAAVERLNKIIRATGAYIVVSSDWGNFHSYEWIEGFLVAHGLDMDYDDVIGRRRRIIGVTPKKFSSTRSQEINFWLRNALEDDGLKVDSFVILDDNTNAGYFHPDRFVNTDPKYGLLDEHVEKAIEILNTPCKSE